MSKQQISGVGNRSNDELCRLQALCNLQSGERTIMLSAVHSKYPEVDWQIFHISYITIDIWNLRVIIKEKHKGGLI